DRVLRMEEQRLLRGKVPLVAETLLAITGAEFPERRIPGCAVALARSRTGGDQPSLHHVLQKTVLHEAFTMNTAQFVRAEHTSSALLKRLEHIERFSQFLVRRRHSPSSYLDHHKLIVLCKYKHIMCITTSKCCCATTSTSCI